MAHGLPSDKKIIAVAPRGLVTLMSDFNVVRARNKLSLDSFIILRSKTNLGEEYLL